MRVCLFILTLLVLFVSVSAVVPAADREPFSGLAPASNVYGDAVFRRAVADADEWWLVVSGRRPPPLSLFLYKQDSGDAAQAAYSSGTVYLTREYRDLWWRAATTRSWPLAMRRALLAQAWGIAAHERGHSLGLRHPDSGCPGTIMCPGVSTVPGRALSWARKALPRSRSRFVPARP